MTFLGVVFVLLNAPVPCLPLSGGVTLVTNDECHTSNVRKEDAIQV